MGFNFHDKNSIANKVRRFTESISPIEKARERSRQEHLKNVEYGDKIYFRVESIKVNKIYTSKYLVFFTQKGIVKPPFLNEKQGEILDIIIKTNGKGYIREVKKEGKKFKEITQLERCPQIPKGLEKAIESGLAISLN